LKTKVSTMPSYYKSFRNLKATSSQAEILSKT